MTIRCVSAHSLSLPYDLGGPKPIFAGKEREMELLLIRVETTDGLVGWGESFGFAIWPSTVEALERLVAPLAIGQDEAHISKIHEDITRKLHPLGRAGPVTYAISGLDTALWDIAGQRLSQPLSHMLARGRTIRQQVPAYASLIRYNNPDLVAKSAAKAVSMGFKAIKIHEITWDAIAATRQAIGPDVLLMVDANCPWDEAQALLMCERLQALHLHWLEEPLWPPEDHAGLARIQREGRIPTAAGENALGYQDFKSLINSSAVSFAQPSVTKIGGISEFMKVAHLIKSSGVHLAPHSPYMGPGLMATAHILAGMEEEIMLEYTFCDMPHNPLGDAVLTHNGHFTVPSTPGLGIEIDERMVQALKIT
jgi:L-alanine-DL-glutamate epimerase-like enolase superfamily enzyme